MNNWILLSLIAPALYAAVNFVDKYLVEHKIKDSRGMPIYIGIVALFFGSAVWLIGGGPLLSTHNSLLVLLAGAITMWGVALYFFALAKDHTSYIIALLQTTPIFTLVLSLVILDEPLTRWQLLGFFLVFLAAMGLSVDRVEKKLRLDSAFYAIVLANTLFAIAAIVIKFTVNLDGFVPILAYESWGMAIGGLTLFLAFKNVRRAFITSYRAVSSNTLVILFLNESLAVCAKALTFLAISLGPVALVGALGGTQVFYGLLYGVILTLLLPKLFHEDIGRRDLISKAVFSLILLTGIWCIGQA